jgi:hypothetical protein
MGHRSSAGRGPTIAAVDRRSQVLPIPLGGLSPVRRQSSALLRRYRRHQSAALLAVAGMATGAAVWLSTSPRSFTVEMTASGVRVGDVLLTATAALATDGIRVFSGQASLALSPTKAGTAHGAAVMLWKGVATTGQCVLHVLPLSAAEACHFKNATAELTAIDTFDFASRLWHRHYGDGVEITIMVPKGGDLIPIPFPLGR